MNFNWAEYYLLAKELCVPNEDGTIDEAKFRSAISRAYYAVFCKARNFLKNKGANVPRDGSTHEFVKEMFIRSNDKTWKRIGLSLQRLKMNRTFADYEDVFASLQKTAEASIKEAERSLSRLDTIH